MDRAGWNYPPGEIRVSDADRDQALFELSQARQAGRVTAEEFDERSAQALTSRTGNELTALLADLPVPQPRVTAAPAPNRDRRVLATGIAVVAGVAAIWCVATAAGAALSIGPTLAQREFIERMAASQGLPVPQLPPSPGFDWAGTVTPAAVAVLLVALIVFLRVRVARADRSKRSGHDQ